MKKMLVLSAILSCLAINIVSAQAFTPGNIVVLRIGDGSIDLDGNAQPVFLDEYTPSGSLVRSISMPTSVNGANRIYTLPANQPILGVLTLSPDHKYLAAVGFDAAVGTANGDVLSSNSISRTIAIVDPNGSINTSTNLSPAIVDISYPVSAVTSNGTDIWASFFNTGIFYTTIGSTTATNIVESFAGIYRVGGISDGQLYFTTNTGRLRTVDTGLPTTLTDATNVPGLSTAASGQSCFWFADLSPSVPGNDVLYVAHENVNALRKYSYDLSTSTWVLNGTIGVDADDYGGITGVVNGTSVTLYATRKIAFGAAGGGEIVTLTDNTGYTTAPNTFVGTPTVIKSAANRTAIRGISVVPSLPVQPSISISAKAYFQGAYSALLVRHKDVTPGWAAVLNSNALSQPFTGSPFNYAGTESVASGFFTSTAATTDIVDWVLTELHDATTPSTVVASKAAFIREDGMIVGLDGTSNPSFTGVPAGNYYLVIRHRNHLSVRSASPIAVNNSPSLYDFTTAQSQAYQDVAITTNTAMVDLGSGIFGLWGGDANNNGAVNFTGSGNDSDALLTLLGNQAAVLNGVYNKADLNLDGQVRYTGLNNDAGILIKALKGNQQATVAQH